MSLHALNANTDTALVSIPRPLRNNSLDGVPQWAQAFINAFYIEADLAALIFIGQELQIEMYVAHDLVLMQMFFFYFACFARVSGCFNWPMRAWHSLPNTATALASQSFLLSRTHGQRRTKQIFQSCSPKLIWLGTLSTQ